MLNTHMVRRNPFDGVLMSVATFFYRTFGYRPKSRSLIGSGHVSYAVYHCCTSCVFSAHENMSTQPGIDIFVLPCCSSDMPIGPRLFGVKGTNESRTSLSLPRATVRAREHVNRGTSRPLLDTVHGLHFPCEKNSALSILANWCRHVPIYSRYVQQVLSKIGVIRY